MGAPGAPPASACGAASSSRVATPPTGTGVGVAVGDGAAGNSGCQSTEALVEALELKEGMGVPWEVLFPTDVV